MCVCNFVYCHNVGTNCKPSNIRDITQSSLLRTARRSHQLYFSDTSCRILSKSDKKNVASKTFHLLSPVKRFLHRTELHDTHTDYIFQTHPVEFYSNGTKKCGKQNISFIVPSKVFLTPHRTARHSLTYLLTYSMEQGPS